MASETTAVSDDINISSPPVRQRGHQNVFARLQALFPPNPNSTAAVQQNRVTTNTPAPNPMFLKVRILTWNMHDSVPKGDLTELLGSVSSYSSPHLSSQESVFPMFSNDTNHPYHLVVVAGQECPTLSGIPMGLGAGFKLIDKDKDQVKETERNPEYSRSRLRAKENDDVLNRWKNFEDSHEVLGHHPSGWTSMIEDWFCYNDGPSTNASSPTISDSGGSSSPNNIQFRRNACAKERRKGPYQLLIKERLMGIYLAVYINRDIREFVRGTSKSAVAAGLIGGRLGNKGGVGISLNINGTTFLFINAHLAAHGGKQHHRLANLAKIKTELSVESFLRPDDPRLVAEDITDRFDYTFVCGDLNFRLEISRLHADWLISRQEYSQALAFDQLRNLMEKGEAFVGFKEARINFPPTFKYDVLRPLKKKKGSKRQLWKHVTDKASHFIHDGEEKEEQEEVDDDGVDDEFDVDAASMSSAWTSNSKLVEDQDYFQATPLSQNLGSPGGRLSFAVAASKAKSKWLDLLSPISPRQESKPNRAFGHPQTPNGKLQIPCGLHDSQASPGSNSLTPDGEHRSFLRPFVSARTSSTKIDRKSFDEDQGDEKGVYDSSHKQRVPSWCDRILWKSTVKSFPEVEEDEPQEGSARSRTRVGQFFALAFRPLSGRARQASYSSVDLPRISPRSDTRLPLSSTDGVLATAVPFARFATLTQPERLKHPKSNEILRVSQIPRKSSHDDLRGRRATIGVYLPSPRTDSPTRGEIPSTVHSARPATRKPARYSSLPTPSRWRFFPFLSRDPTNSSITPETHAPVDILSSPRKGDIVCLSYNTLDDAAMHRLEGRSDHRPVIGSYAVYI